MYIYIYISIYTHQSIKTYMYTYTSYTHMHRSSIIQTRLRRPEEASYDKGGSRSCMRPQAQGSIEAPPLEPSNPSW